MQDQKLTSRQPAEMLQHTKFLKPVGGTVVVQFLGNKNRPPYIVPRWQLRIRYGIGQSFGSMDQGVGKLSL